MQPDRLIEYVVERDVDLLLLEELNVSADFRSWFVEKVFGQDVLCNQFLGARHSVRHPTLGQSDLLILFQDTSHGTAAILIENKIDAPSQPEQAERYRKRGNVGIEDGKWATFRTCMTAPKTYLDANADAQLYDACLSYESIRDWFRASNDGHSAYRARFIQEAIERQGYVADPHEGVTKFWMDYWRFAREKFPLLQMKEPGPIPAGSDWPVFCNPELGSTRRIVHKLAAGAVDLEIESGAGRIEAIALRNRDVLRDGLELTQTGKSASFRICAPVVDRFGDFQMQIDAVRVGLSAASRLLDLSAQIDADL